MFSCFLKIQLKIEDREVRKSTYFFSVTCLASLDLFDSLDGGLAAPQALIAVTEPSLAVKGFRPSYCTCVCVLGFVADFRRKPPDAPPERASARQLDLRPERPAPEQPMATRVTRTSKYIARAAALPTRTAPARLSVAAPCKDADPGRAGHDASSLRRPRARAPPWTGGADVVFGRFGRAATPGSWARTHCESHMSAAPSKYYFLQVRPLPAPASAGAAACRSPRPRPAHKVTPVGGVHESPFATSG